MFPDNNIRHRNLATASAGFFRLGNAPRLRQDLTTDQPGGVEHQRSTRERSIPPIPDPVAKLTRECASLRLKLATERRHYYDPSQSLTPITDTSVVALMGHELDVTKDDVGRLRGEVVTLEDRCGKLEKTLQEMREMLKSRDKELEKIKKERDQLLKDRTESAAIHQSTTKQRREGRGGKGYHSNGKQNGKQAFEGDISYAKKTQEISGMDLLLSMSPTALALEEQRARTQGIETFMTKTDSWSGSQIIEAVQDLNSEVLQYAASAAELCLDRSPGPTQAKCQEATLAIESRLGECTARVLSTRNHTQDPILVQFALQASVFACIIRCFSSFCVGLPSKPDVFFSQIFFQMRLYESQPTSSRWRALTHRCIHVLHPRLEDQAIDELVNVIFRWSADVLCVAKSPVALSSKEALKARFGVHMRRVALAACRLARVTKEEIMSTNFEPLIVEQGRSFEPDDVIDAFADYGPTRGRVLCTTEMGVKCSTIKKEGGRSTEGRKILLKPKAIFESAVQVLGLD